MSDPIRVLIADDHAVLREGLRSFLELQDGIEIVGDAADGAEAVALAEQLRPAVVLMDLVMPKLDGVEAMRALRERVPETRVIILTSYIDDDRLLPAVRAGAAGYLLKNAEPQELARAIRAADAGEALIDPSVAARLVERLAEDDGRDQLQSLTPREREVLELIGRGFSNKRIALELGLAEKTVKTHVTHVLGKPDAGRDLRGTPQVLGPIPDTDRDRRAPTVRRMPIGIVTGTSRGLGLALARALTERGWRLVVDARGRAELEGAWAGNDNVITVAGDIADPRHRAALVEAAGDTVDLVVNNASVLGPSPLPPLAEYSLDELRHVYEINVTGPLALVQLALPRLANGARVVNVTSDAAVEPYEGWGGYGSSKAALEQLTAILGAEHPGLRIYAVDPGDMRTQMHQDAFPGEDISDRPLPEESVPGLLELIEGDLPSGRYKARELVRLEA